jgi:hypothetical protein
MIRIIESLAADWRRRRKGIGGAGRTPASL